MDQKFVVTAVVVVLVAAVLALRLSRLLRPQPLDTSRMWIMPAILSAFTLYLIMKLPGAGAASMAFLVGSLLLGFGLGWLRAKTVRLTLDPATGRIIAQSSAAAVVFLLALFAIRSLVRWSVMSGAVSLPLSAQSFDAVFLAFAAALFVARTLELSIRARRLRAGLAS